MPLCVRAPDARCWNPLVSRRSSIGGSSSGSESMCDGPQPAAAEKATAGEAGLRHELHCRPVDRREVLERLAALGLVAPAIAVERTYFFGPWAPEEPPKLWADDIHDDALALQWYLDHGRQIPRGLYRSTARLKFRSGELVSGTVFNYDYRVGDPATAAFIKSFPSYSPLDARRLDEATQKRWLERDSNRVREHVLFFAKCTDEVLRDMAKHATPDEVHVEARVMSQRDFEALDQLPAVDYSGLTLEQARESLYRTVLESHAGSGMRGSISSCLRFGVTPLLG